MQTEFLIFEENQIAMNRTFIILAIASLGVFSSCKKDNKSEYSEIVVHIRGHLQYGGDGVVKYQFAGSAPSEHKLSPRKYPNAELFEASRSMNVGDKIYFAAQHNTETYVDPKDDAIQTHIVIEYTGTASAQDPNNIRVVHSVLSHKDVFREVEIIVPAFNDVKNGNYTTIKDFQ